MSKIAKNKLMSAGQAVSLIRPGSTLLVGGAGGVQEPDMLIEALVERYLSTGGPGNLTEIHPIRTGEIEGRGTSRFGVPGLIRRMIGGSFWPVGVPEFIRQINANEIEAYNFSIGIIYAMLEAAAANRPGVVSQVGLGTFQDPAHGGGALNQSSKEKFVQRIDLNGEPCLFYRALAADTCFIRATTADSEGNLSFEDEPAMIAPLLLAQVVRASRGTVIAQVKNVVPPGSLSPHAVRVPASLVDAIVVNPDQTQTTHSIFDPTLVGRERKLFEHIPFQPFSAKKIVIRRALLEARPGELLAIGFGVAGFLPSIALEENVLDLVTFTIEHGVFGGINGYAAGGKTFPVAHNPSAIIDAADQLRFFAGGAVDRAFLGVGEVDVAGNVNVSRFGDRISGAGGFIEMTQSISNIVFCMSLGNHADRKVVQKVQDLTFNAAEARKRGQSVTYVCEKAVFRLTEAGLELSEVAPGIDVRVDLLDRLACEVSVSDRLVEYPAECFSDAPMNLRDRWVR